MSDNGKSLAIYKSQQRIKMAIEYIESFIECDMDKDHHCECCGSNSANQLDHSEILKALKELKV